MTRIWALAALAAGIWLLSVYGPARPVALGLDTPTAQFSAARADAVLGRILGPQLPHPSGSPEAAAVRARILRELAALGMMARTVTAQSCFSEPSWHSRPCGTITNIIADVLPGTGRAVLLMAHSDSVAAGPGAADDGSGVAIILETARALKARSHVGHPVIALFTDGEEKGLLGAAAYVRDSRVRANVGAVINVEAGGNQGPSYLFQTSPGDARLVDLYAKSVTHVATSSLYAEIYKVLPYDTDLTPMLEAGVTGYNFAFIGNAADYHTRNDRRENIDPRSVQQQGEAMLGLADTLARTDFAVLKGGNAIYLDLLGRWLPRLSESLALPFSIASFILIVLAGVLTPPDRRAIRRPIVAALMPPLLLGGCIAMGFGLHAIAARIAGNVDPSAAHPALLRLSLAFGAWTVALLAARVGARIACWLWFAALAIACAVFAPGATPYFLFPAAVAAPMLLLTARAGRPYALLASAIAGLVVWMAFNAGSEALMPLNRPLLFTATAAFGLVAVLPLLAGIKGRAWTLSVTVSLAGALALAIAAGAA